MLGLKRLGVGRKVFSELVKCHNLAGRGSEVEENSGKLVDGKACNDIVNEVKLLSPSPAKSPTTHHPITFNHEGMVQQ